MPARVVPCAICGAPRGKGSHSGLCIPCNRTDKTGEVEFMLTNGRTPADIAVAYGIRQNSLARSMRRLGRNDLANRIESWHAR